MADRGQGRVLLSSSIAAAMPGTYQAVYVEAILGGREQMVAGSLSTKAQGAAAAVLPESANAAMHGRMAEPGTASSE